MTKGLLYCDGPNMFKCAECPGRESEDGNCWILNDANNEKHIANLKKLLERATALLGYYNAEVRRRGSEAPDVDAVLVDWEALKGKLS